MATQGPNNPGTAVDDASTGTATWSDPGNVTSSDDVKSATSISPGGFTHYLKATNFGFAIPSGAAIDGIVVEVEKIKSGAANAQDDKVRIVKGGAIGATDKASGTNWPTTDAYTTYGGTTDLWGETWTGADINASSFGMVISARHTSGGAPVAVSIDHIRITVYYTGGSQSNYFLMM